MGEISPEIETLFGVSASRHYQDHAYNALRASIEGTDIDAWCALDGESAAALLFAQRSQDRITLSFLHTTTRWRDSEAPARLLQTFLRARWTENILICTDYLPMDGVNMEAQYTGHGFACTRRQLMDRTLANLRPDTPDAADIRRATRAEVDAYAELLHTAYRDARQEMLLPEVASVESARAFVSKVWDGAFGGHNLTLSLGAWQEDKCLGIILGTQLYPRTGFVIHLAVQPDARNAGLATALLRTSLHQMQTLGMERVVLGVTTENPAVRLYEREGFELLRPLPVYLREPHA